VDPSKDEFQDGSGGDGHERENRDLPGEVATAVVAR
jgi:hypothetical protein